MFYKRGAVTCKMNRKRYAERSNAFCVKPADIAAYAETLLGASRGIGIYSQFCHVDVRGEKSRWKG